MFSFTCNKKVDLSAIDFAAKTWQGREWLSTLYLRAVKGEYGTNPERNADAFGLKAENLQNIKDVSDFIPILSDEESLAYTWGINGTRSLELSCEMHSSIEDESAYATALDEFISMRELIFLDTNSVDLAEILRGVSLYEKHAIAALKGLFVEYEGLDRVITDLLGGSHWLEDLHRVLQSPITVDTEWAEMQIEASAPKEAPVYSAVIEHPEAVVSAKEQVAEPVAVEDASARCYEQLLEMQELIALDQGTNFAKAYLQSQTNYFQRGSVRRLFKLYAHLEELVQEFIGSFADWQEKLQAMSSAPLTTES